MEERTPSSAAGIGTAGARVGAQRRRQPRAAGAEESSEAVRIHPLALCESEAVGTGTRVEAFARVADGARIGRNCTLDVGCFVGGGAVLGDNVIVRNGTSVFDNVTCADDVFLGPQVVFADGVHDRMPAEPGRATYLPTKLGRGVSLGAGTVVACGVQIGEYAFAAPGSIITRDVPAFAFVAGHPARVKGWVCVDGRRLDRELRCPGCERTYELASASRGLRLAPPSRAAD